MGMPAANANSTVLATDTHIVMVPSPGGPVPTLLPHVFSGMLDGSLEQSVKIAGQPAAVIGSTATNNPSHIPTPPGTSFQSPPANQGTVQMGSSSVFIGGKGAARVNDTVQTCNDPADAPVGTILGGGTVFIGG